MNVTTGKWITAAVVVLVALVLILTAGGNGGAEQATGPTENDVVEPVEKDSPVGTEVGGRAPISLEKDGDLDFAPDFTFALVGGGSLTLSDYRGKKPVILDFFATWCHNCQRAMPELNTWYNKYENQIEVIAVNMQEGADRVAGFIDKYGLDFPVVLDPRKDARNAYGVASTNFHVLIGRSGEVVGAVPGDMTESQVLALIERS